MILTLRTARYLLAFVAVLVEGAPAPDVDTRYPYLGPAVPIGDFVDDTIEGNGSGFVRIKEPPAVSPRNSKPSNNINVISTAFIPNGINIHFQTPFGLGSAPTVYWGTSATSLNNTATGDTNTYARTPSCSAFTDITMCSEFFHNVQISGLQAETTYYYQIQAANGTTESDVLSVTTNLAAGSSKEFTVAVLNDMGYTNAEGTYAHLLETVTSGEVAFAWHGGDLSYADDWYSGFLPCDLNETSEDFWPVCYNGTSSYLSNVDIGAEYNEAYNTPLPEGEIPNQGGPNGGDMSPIYETNWDLWQQWMNNITLKIPYMVMLGNHETACAEFDSTPNPLSALLNHNITNGTEPEAELTYYSCPASQRNYTAFQHRFRMPGEETGGRTNFWYSFDYGLAHFISFDSETDFPDSPDYPFARDVTGNETLPTANETYITDSGPFGTVGNYSDVKTYEQYQWLKSDLESVDRCKTPWVFAMSHRPMYSSQISSYQKHIRAAFEELFLDNGVDVYLSGHIHWYERLFPLGRNGTIDHDSIVNNHTYKVNNGQSMTHLINGMAGNIESHSQLAGAPQLEMSVVLDQIHYGFSKLTVFNETTVGWDFVKAEDGSLGDYVVLTKSSNYTCKSNSSSTPTVSSSGSVTAAPNATSTGASQANSASMVSITTLMAMVPLLAFII